MRETSDDIISDIRSDVKFAASIFLALVPVILENNDKCDIIYQDTVFTCREGT